jgi:hypothetical protein
MSNGTTALRTAFRFLQQVPADRRTPEYVREHQDELWDIIDPCIFASLRDTKDGVDVEFTDERDMARVQFSRGGARVSLFDDSTEKWVGQ